MRTCPVLWAVPVLLILADAHVSQSLLTASSSAVTAAAASAVILIAPVCAASGAWQLGRLRADPTLIRTSARSRARIVFDAVWVDVVVGLGVVVGVLAVSTWRAGVPPDVPLAAAGMSALVAWTAVGAGLGHVVALPVAVPAAAVTSYVALTFPVALEPVWLRHLSGVWFSCCPTDVVFASSAMLPAVAVAATLLAIAGTMMSGLPRFRAVAACLVVGLVGIAAATNLAQPIGIDPYAPRPESQLQCTGDDVEWCVWPEHASSVAALDQVGAASYRRWQQAGVAVPDGFTEGRPGTNAQFVAAPQPTPVQLRISLATGLEQWLWGCAPGQVERAIGLALIAGAEPNELAGRYDETTLEAGRRWADPTRHESPERTPCGPPPA